MSGLHQDKIGLSLVTHTDITSEKRQEVRLL